MPKALLAAAALLALAAPAPAPAQARRGPAGPAFYDPPARLVAGHPGTVVWQRPADPLVRLAGARRTFTIVYRSRSVGGVPNVESASVALPRTRPPWRTVVFDHVTTGSADVCAPTRVTPGNTERERMTRGDTFANLLLARGFAVVRPDYEGIGTPGPHPYLIGRSLARAGVDAFRAARDADGRLAREWAVAGHSEGGLGALFTGELAHTLAPGLPLKGVAAFAPPSHMRDLTEAATNVKVDGPGIDGLSSLGALIIGGAAAADPRLGPLYRAGALSAMALALYPHIEQRCLNDLTKHDSWGGLAPGEIPGPRYDDAKDIFFAVLDANDPRTVHIPAGLPVRIDQGAMDAVVPIAFTEQLVSVLRGRGTDVTYTRYPTATHVTITDADQAAPAAAAWLTLVLRK